MSGDRQETGTDAAARQAAGLCATCVHAVRVTSSRGSEFWQCGLSAVDARFPKYPRLPVLQCSGYLNDGITRP